MLNMIFMLLILAVGVGLLVSTARIQKETKGKSPSDQLIAANRGLLVLSVTFIVTAISYGICNFRCDCGDIPAMSGLMYAGFFTILGIITGSLGTVIVKHSGDDLPVTKSIGRGITGVGFTLVGVIVIGYLINTFVIKSPADKAVADAKAAQDKASAALADAKAKTAIAVKAKAASKPKVSLSSSF